MSQEDFDEYEKQCFYINIYNALILFKISEIAALRPTKLWDSFKNYSSWVAVQHNAHIIIGNKRFSAFEIRQLVIKNITADPPSEWRVRRDIVHPLIEFAFF